MHFGGGRSAFRTLLRAAGAMVSESLAPGLAQEPVLPSALVADPLWHDKYLASIGYIGFVR